MSRKMGMSVRDIAFMYDQQFNQKLKIARFLVKNLPDKRDIDLARKWLRRVCDVKSCAIEVKRNRNAFLTYMIKVLREGVLRGCTESDWHTVCDPDKSLAFLDFLDSTSIDDRPTTTATEAAAAAAAAGEPSAETTSSQRLQFWSMWSADRRTYVAVKSLPGRGALVYMAVSKRAGLSHWHLPFSSEA